LHRTKRHHEARRTNINPAGVNHMTRYFIIAAFLGVFALASVSFIAQAQEEEPSYETDDAPPPPANRAQYQEAQVEAYQDAKSRCEELVDTREPAENEDDPDAANAKAYSNCMKGHNYSDKKIQEIETQIETQQ